MIRLILIVCFTVLSGTVQSAAQGSCGGRYTVARGDTLTTIADRYYQDASKWTVIFNSNQNRIGSSQNNIRAGDILHLPCLDGLPVGLDAMAPEKRKITGNETKTRAPTRFGKITFLTADGMPPFADRAAMNGGLIHEMVMAAMENAPVAGHKTYWINDRAAHLEPLLTDVVFDMGYPWPRPDCAGDPAARDICETYLFSDPLFELLEVLFVRSAQRMMFESDADAEGKRFCRPAGFPTVDMDMNGRNWISGNKITLIRALSVEACFDLLMAGEVDAVATNEFTGNVVAKSMGLLGQVEPLRRPVAIQGLSVVIHSAHPEAQALMDMMNSRIRAIKSAAVHHRIVEKHLRAFWEESG